MINRYDYRADNRAAKFICDQHSEKRPWFVVAVCCSLWEADSFWAEKSERLLWVQAPRMPKELAKTKNKLYFDRKGKVNRQEKVCSFQNRT